MWAVYKYYLKRIIRGKYIIKQMNQLFYHLNNLPILYLNQSLLRISNRLTMSQRLISSRDGNNNFLFYKTSKCYHWTMRHSPL